MDIKQVRIIEGSETPVGDGIIHPNRAFVRLEDSSTARAIIKKLDDFWTAFWALQDHRGAIF